MVLLPYIVTLAGCLGVFLSGALSADPWWKVAAYLAAGWGVAALAQWIAYAVSTRSVEYLGAVVTEVYFEEGWTEQIWETVETRDCFGFTHRKEVLKETRYHAPVCNFSTSFEGEWTSRPCSRDFFDLVTRQWGAPCHVGVFTDPKKIRGGERRSYRCFFSEAVARGGRELVPVTIPRGYTNPLLRSDSLFEVVPTREVLSDGELFDRPAIDPVTLDAPCVVAREGVCEVGEETADAFRRFNGEEAPRWKMRLFVLLFPASAGVGVAERQRARWRGGQRNELTVCAGVSPDGSVAWAKAFSWSDHPELETACASWLLRQGGRLDLRAFLDWFAQNACRWQPKSFDDFSYLRYHFPLWQQLLVLALTVAANVGAWLWLANRG